jgi:hypothetical protein
MTQARNAILRKNNELTCGLERVAGQKARGDWQTLPGAGVMAVR